MVAVVILMPTMFSAVTGLRRSREQSKGTKIASTESVK